MSNAVNILILLELFVVVSRSLAVVGRSSLFIISKNDNGMDIKYE